MFAVQFACALPRSFMSRVRATMSHTAREALSHALHTSRSTRYMEDALDTWMDVLDRASTTGDAAVAFVAHTEVAHMSMLMRDVPTSVYHFNEALTAASGASILVPASPPPSGVLGPGVATCGVGGLDGDVVATLCMALMGASLAHWSSGDVDAARACSAMYDRVQSSTVPPTPVPSGSVRDSGCVKRAAGVQPRDERSLGVASTGGDVNGVGDNVGAGGGAPFSKRQRVFSGNSGQTSADGGGDGTCSSMSSGGSTSRQCQTRTGAEHCAGGGGAQVSSSASSGAQATRVYSLPQLLALRPPASTRVPMPPSHDHPRFTVASTQPVPRRARGSKKGHRGQRGQGGGAGRGRGRRNKQT